IRSLFQLEEASLPYTLLSLAIFYYHRTGTATAITNASRKILPGVPTSFISTSFEKDSFMNVSMFSIVFCETSVSWKVCRLISASLTVAIRIIIMTGNYKIIFIHQPCSFSNKFVQILRLCLKQ
ncbi:MAG: hypothetical protein SGI83_10990, partial [Bacteroidota bacterium]|nr:hypothetical protein [Bacteroidota bacterium]